MEFPEDNKETLSRIENLKRNILNDIKSSQFLIMTMLSEEVDDTLQKALLEMYRNYQDIEMKVIVLKGKM